MGRLLVVLLTAVSFAAASELAIAAKCIAVTCSGGANCSACTNCPACQPSAKAGGTCSMCRPDPYRKTSASKVLMSKVSIPTSTRVSTLTSFYATPRATRRPAASTGQTPDLSIEVAQPIRATARRTTAPLPAPVTVPQEFTARCIGVSEDDTITVLYQKGTTKQSVKVRLYGIDAPESKQAYGTQAKKHLSEMIVGKNVRLYAQGTDQHGRLLAWVFVGKECANARQVEDGFAWWYQQYAPDEKKLSELQAAAKAAKRGLWHDAAPIAPWQWREEQSKSSTSPSAAPMSPSSSTPLENALPNRPQPPPPSTPTALATPPATPPATPLAKPRADLIISQVVFDPARPKVGQALQPIVYYKNIGNKTAKDFYIGLAANALTAGGFGLGGDFAVLAPGEEKKYYWGGLQPQKAGKFELSFTVDLKNDIVESNEGNNSLVVTLEVVE
jgi:micrococcal nuclease